MAAVMHGALADLDRWEPGDRCSISRALDVVGTRTAILILRESYYGTTRFDGFARRVGISDAVASARLRALVDEGLLAKRPYQEPGQRTRHEYTLTPKGTALMPVVFGLMQWGDTYLQGDGGPMQLLADDTGEPLTVAVSTEQGRRVPLDEVRVTQRHP
ncbi:winged helix-turn-helix transcriptional regulator [Luteipulveratus mongoliensis]|uniref:Transcriptional regulator n=1 Tax=Luteipulveratus mongoliensis TaxID=571913 RepID=A0A0K1JP96_9MICO|nr:helix-turn-helix domain-containing protein [Luteipulveratus mongoliensis]AKU18408.1 transcriptional regulator [Luteipulveratus mongoliensis]